MRVLFIGGTGILSSACARAALSRSMELTLLIRDRSRRHPVPAGARVLHADVREAPTVRRLLGSERFDVVVQWVGMKPADVENDLSLFSDRTAQYVFISSASVYAEQPPGHVITEATPLNNPHWEYARDKIACEERLLEAHLRHGFPVTIVRPSHTYDVGLLPIRGGYTFIERMRQGRPVVVHGDGASLWTLTHHQDFARGFVGVLGLREAVGEAVHITSDEVLTWDQIVQTLARAADVAPHIVHVPAQVIASFDADWGASVLGDKCHSKVFDNTKIKRLVPSYRATIPFEQGAREQIAWYEADQRRRVVDEKIDRTIDRILEDCALARESRSRPGD